MAARMISQGDLHPMGAKHCETRGEKRNRWPSQRQSVRVGTYEETFVPGYHFAMVIAPTSAGPCTGPLVRTCPAPFYISNSLSSAPPTCVCARGEVCGVGGGGEPSSSVFSHDAGVVHLALLAAIQHGWLRSVRQRGSPRQSDRRRAFARYSLCACVGDTVCC